MKKMNLWIEKYDDTKYFGLYNDNDLVCVTVYKKGAQHVKQILEKMEAQMDELVNITSEDGIEGPVPGGFNYERWANGSRKGVR